MDNEKAICELCGEPMPEGEEMFNYHGYSGNCPKPPLPRPAEPEQAASDDLLAAAKEFMLARHRLYFQRLENLTVGSNFIHSAAEFAAQRTAELEKRVEELERILKQIHSIACLCIHKHTEYTASAWMADIENRCTAAFLFAKERISQAKEDR